MKKELKNFSNKLAGVTRALPVLMVSLTATLALTLTACEPKQHATPNIEVIQDMMEQDAVKAQSAVPWDRHSAGGMLPPQGTVPQGYKPYPYHNDVLAAEKNLKNPLANDFSPETLKLGQTKFETYCLVCHGPEAKGNGPVAEKMILKPANLHDDRLLKANDGHYYHVISDGLGGMSGYAYQLVNEKDRWAIVNYIRTLQKQNKAQ